MAFKILTLGHVLIDIPKIVAPRVLDVSLLLSAHYLSGAEFSHSCLHELVLEVVVKLNLRQFLMLLLVLTILIHFWMSHKIILLRVNS